MNSRLLELLLGRSFIGNIVIKPFIFSSSGKQMKMSVGILVIQTWMFRIIKNICGLDQGAFDLLALGRVDLSQSGPTLTVRDKNYMRACSMHTYWLQAHIHFFM